MRSISTRSSPFSPSASPSPASCWRCPREAASGRSAGKAPLAGVVLGVLLAAAYGFQTAGLERTTVSSTGFITGLYLVLTPLLALVLFRQSTAAVVWIGAGMAVIGFALLSGIDVGAPTGDLLVLASALATALQILMVERYASRHDALALTLVEMATAFLGFLLIALVLGQLAMPRGWTVWGALIVTGVFASALGFLIQVWAQRRISATRIALVFSRIVVAEPAAADVLRRFAAPQKPVPEGKNML
jgi:drug/metabolite transporter (DMT)-like permease